MKHITSDQYMNIKTHLTDWLDEHPRPYDTLFSMINGREFGTTHGFDGKPLLRMAKIRKIWDSRYYRTLVTLVIYVHYKGCILETPKESKIITNDEITHLAKILEDKVRESDTIEC